MSLDLAVICDLAVSGNVEPRKGDRIFVFSDYKRLQIFIIRIKEILQAREIPFYLYGNCCFDFKNGVRMIFVVRHSSRWVDMIRGYNVVAWMSDTALEDREVEFMNAITRS